jgi:uncharacterized protein YndB with AHSA1/START domain
MMSEEYGLLTRANGYITAVMEREVDVPIDAVWEMLSKESERVKWLAPGIIDLKQGGRARLDFKDSYVMVDSEVVACEAPRLLAFSWSAVDELMRPNRFLLKGTDSGCKIHLEVSIPEDEVVARSCAGWEAHLTMMQTALAGAPTKFPLGRFQACRENFDAQLLTLMMADMEVLRL